MSFKEICRSSSTLYISMEARRKDIPDMNREDYIPIFVMEILSALLNRGIKDELDIASRCSIIELDDDFSSTPVDLLNRDEENKCILSQETRKLVHSLLHFAKLACQTFKIGKGKFRDQFMKMIELPCLELLWNLDRKYNLLEISSYLMHLSLQTQVDHFTRQLVSFCFSSNIFDSNAKSIATPMLYDFMEAVLIAVHCNPLGNKRLEDLKIRADEILTQICSRLTSTDSTEYSYMSQQFLMTIFQEVPIPKTVKCSFFSDQILRNLTLDNMEISVSSLDVIRHQEKFARSSESPKASYFSMLTGPPQSCHEVVQLLEKSLSGSVVHWENALLVMTEWIKRREYEAISLLTEMIKRLMETGLSSKSEQDVITAFILARHCSLVAPREFLRYEKWYTNMFESDVYSPAKDPEAFNFLTNLLSAWIPLEPPCFLQVHATFWPYVPPGCRNAFSDYVSLAKVRIAEYNEVEEAMEYEPNPNNPLQYDVEMAVKTYDNTKKTPSSIAKMWMFRKEYYLKMFLPALLKKPPGETLTDARLRLIEVLNLEGKIPPNLYNTYKKQTMALAD